MCCDGIVTEFNKEEGILLSVFRASISTTGFTNKSLHVKHVLHTEALQSHATASVDGGRTKVKGCLCRQVAVLPVQLGENYSHYFIVGTRIPWATFGTALCSVALSTRQNTFYEYVTLRTALFSFLFSRYITYVKLVIAFCFYPSVLDI
jgi:hypothetical protein